MMDVVQSLFYYIHMQCNILLHNFLLYNVENYFLMPILSFAYYELVD